MKILSFDFFSEGEQNGENEGVLGFLPKGNLNQLIKYQLISP